MAMDAVLTVQLPSRMKREINEAAGGDGKMAAWAREACSEKLRRPSMSQQHRFAEVVLEPRTGSGTLDALLELVASRQPLVGDFFNADGAMDPAVKAAIYRALPRTQARRMEWAFTGRKLEAIGHLENCSKQAVHASVQRGAATLATDYRFAKALCDAYGESDLDPRILIEAAHERQKQKERNRKG